jgi:GMP synthase (glutamine-hydrolysing)
MRKIACIQHLEEEGPGALADWARQHDVAVELFRADLGQLPKGQDFAAVVVLGGPFNLDGPGCPQWLEAEKAWLDDWLGQAKPVLGICLGGQLLANRLGAQVGPIDRPEGGWCEIELIRDELIGDEPVTLEVLQWHERGFALPSGSRHLARGADWENQAFAVGDTLIGLQFHPEWTPDIVYALNQRFGTESPLPHPSAEDEARYARVQSWFFKLLDHWSASWPK